MAVKNIYAEEKNQYGSTAAANRSNIALSRTRSAQQNNVWNAEQSTPHMQSYTPQKIKREKSPSERGEEAVWAMLEDDGLLKPPVPKEKEAPAAPTFTTGVGRSDITGPGENTIRGAQNPMTMGVNKSGSHGSKSSGGSFSLEKKADPAPTFEEVMLTAAPDFAAAGIDTSVMQAGFQLGNTAKRLWDDTHIAEGMSVPLYLIEKGLSGAAMGLEGTWNGLVDLSEADVRAQLMAQNIEMQQQALFNDAYREQAERINMQTEAALAGTPEFAEGFRSHRAAEYGQQIDETYDAGGFLKLAGDIASSGGQMIPTIAINGLTGGTMGLPYLFVSAEGNAATEARAGGADDDTAFLYGLLSGGLEVATEKMFDGIPGMKGAWLDNWLADYAETNVGRAALKAAKDSLGEGFEEFTSGMVQPYLAKMWNGDDRDFWQTLGESTPDALYDGFLGAVTSFGMSAPGNLSNLQNARIVDAAIDTMNRGGALSDAQLAKANAAMQALTDSWGKPDQSKWSRNATQQWTDTQNAYFDKSPSRTAGFDGNAVASGQNVPSNFIPLPMFEKPAAAQTEPSVQNNFIPLPMFNTTEQSSQTNASEAPLQANPAATQKAPSVQETFIPLPMFNTTEQSSQTNASEAPLQANPAATQKAPSMQESFIPLPMFNDTAQNGPANTPAGSNQTGSPAAADANVVSSSAVNNTATLQDGQRSLSNFIHLPTGSELAELTNASAENGQSNLLNQIMGPESAQAQANAAGGDNSVLFPGANNAMVQNGQMPFTAEHWTKSKNSDILNNTESDALDYENDIEIGRSVGAKAKNYDVMDLETGEIYHLVEGTKLQNSEVFAGKGTRNELNIAPRYAHKHGGKIEDWQHSKGFGVLATPDGDRPAEIHWMQCSGIGKFDFFVKEWLD